MESTSETESEVKEEEMQRKFEEVTAVKEHAKVSDGEFVFRGPGKLTSEQMGVMVAQLEGIKALGFSDCIQKDGESAVKPENLSPIDAEHYTADSSLSESEKLMNWRKGLYAIARGQVAAVVLAGGQGTRLGSSLPKGIIPLGFGLSKDSKLNSLLCMQAARICRLQYLAKREFPYYKNGRILWIVMTSAATHKYILEHMESYVLPKYGNSACGISRQGVMYVIQDQIPCFDFEGNMFMESKTKVASAPDGNGGLIAALSPRIREILSSGVKYLHVYCVDNVLCRVADPYFIGLCISKHADCAAKVVEKIDPEESVGVICYNKGMPKVIEYSELPPELAAAREEDGRLLYRAGNIANHFFSISFIAQVMHVKLPYHLAKKKITYVDKNGKYVKPEKPNGYKLEKFIFDVFQYAENFHVFEVDREREFSPLKNSDDVGKECLATCWRDYQKECRQMLKCAGAIVPEENGLVYIAPRVSYIGEGLDELRNRRITLPYFMEEDDAREEA